MRKIFLSLLLALSCSSIFASHEMAVEFEFECMGSCTTRVHLRVYRDCSGISAINPASFTFIPSAPGCAVPTPVDSAWSSPAIVEVTPICPSFPTLCTSPSSTLMGVQEYAFSRDYDMCAAGACTFTTGWDDCCRNNAITSGSASDAVYSVQEISPPALIGSCNSSPEYTNIPFFFACVDQTVIVNQGAYDPDGDSLVYALGTCYADPGVPIGYDPGFSPLAPLGPTWNVSLNPTNGNLTVEPVPGSFQVGVLCIYTYEYRGGVLIGTYSRDIQIAVVDCLGNNAPTLSLGNPSDTSLVSITGHNVNVDSAGVPFCFDLFSSDADGDPVTMTWDTNIVSATFSDTSGGTAGITSIVDPVGRFCWTPPSEGVYQFMVTVEDNACPFVGFQDIVVNIVVGGGMPISIADTLVISCMDAVLGVIPAGGVPPYSYAWSGADGLTGSTQFISHTYSSPGTYSYSVSVWDAAGNLSSLSGTTTAGLPSIEGKIITSSSGPLANQRVLLIGYDTTGGGTLSPLDTTLTDPSGNYEFNCVEDTCVYVKAIPDSSAYPDQLPTYYFGTAFWGAASSICPAGGTVTADFITLYGVNPGGPGFISGLVSAGAGKTYGAGDPVAGLDLILWNTDVNHPAAYTTTNVAGYFEFSGLAEGNYAILADKPGVSFSSDDNPNISITASDHDFAGLKLELFSTHLAFETVGIEEDELTWDAGYAFEVMGNPIRHSLSIRYKIPSKTNVKIAILDLQGRHVQTIVDGVRPYKPNGAQLDAVPVQLTPGIYFIEMRAGSFKRTRKILILQ